MPVDAPVASATTHVPTILDQVVAQLSELKALLADRDTPKPKLTRQPWIYVGIPRSTWFRLASAGKTPKAVLLSGTGKHYRTEELDRWVERLRTA